jgi:glucose-1-phosphate cytidylyltransferase
MAMAVILAGGLGTRFIEETSTLPKPLIEIGGRPVLWHIMKLYAHHGMRDFVICAGYRAEAVVDFFAGYAERYGDVEVDLANGSVRLLRRPAEDWCVKVIDTGLATETGGRIRRIAAHVAEEPFFLLTYGDTLTDVDVGGTVAFHRAHGRLATMSVVRPRNRFGSVAIDGGVVTRYREKEPDGVLQLNAGFFVLSPRVLDYIEGDETVWERGPLERLAADRQLMAWMHEGFWQPMDTRAERDALDRMWQSGHPPWRVW